MVICLECNREFKSLMLHLKNRNITVAQYKEKYPGVKLVSEEVKEKSSKTKRESFASGGNYN